MKRILPFLILFSLSLPHISHSWQDHNYRYTCGRTDEQEKLPSIISKIPYIGLLAGAYKIFRYWRYSKRTTLQQSPQNEKGSVEPVTPIVYGFEGCDILPPARSPQTHAVSCR